MDVKLIIYYLCIILGTMLSAVCGYYIGIKKGMNKDTVKKYVAVAIISGIFGALLMGQLQNLIMSFTGLSFYPSRMRIFGGLFFTPFLMYFLVRYIAGDFLQVSDVIAPGAFLITGCSKIGCAVYGCCYGIPFGYGVKTQFEAHRVFPVQLLESVLCFILFAVMLYLVTKNKHRKGTAYPLSLILYGVMRFLVEFLRYCPEAEKEYFFGMSFWQPVSLAAVLTGAVWLTYRYLRCAPVNRSRKRQCEE